MKYRYLLFFVLTCLFISCYDDKGNYDYVDINEVGISGIDQDKFYEKIAFVDTLKLYPEVKGSLYDADTDKQHNPRNLHPPYALHLPG